MRNSFSNFFGKTPQSPKSDLKETKDQILISIPLTKGQQPQKNLVSEDQRKQELLKEKQKAMEIVQKSPLKLKSLPKFQDDKEIVIEATKLNPKAFEFASSKLKDDAGFIVECYKLDNSILSFITPQTKLAMKQIVIEKVTKDPYELRFYPAFHGDRDVIGAAIQQNESVFKYASDGLKENIAFLVQYFKPGSSIISHLPTSGQNEVIELWQKEQNQNYYRNFGK